ncbi:MAG: HAD hydrolase family protein [Spirochaetaceae bacterium]|nr:HAD hydrolase family protein [Spirochaetaceae bacterium]
MQGFRLDCRVIFDIEKRNGNFSKIVLGDDRENLLPLEPKLQSLLGDKASVCFSKPYFLEILPPDGGKGNALRHLTEKVLGLSADDVACFGDSFNDKTMLEYAFNSVAMLNASDEIKALARFSTKFSNNEDGVAKFLEENLIFN